MEAVMKSRLLSARRVETLIDELDRINKRVMGRAYEIFRQRGERLGSALEDWLAAERETLWTPPIEVCRTNADVFVEVAVAGVKPDQLDIKVTPESLLVQSDIDHDHATKAGEVVTCEFEPGRLFRVVTWPARIDPATVIAEYRDGMLYIKAAIASDTQARKVDVHAA
jgi:HSP20 family protein